MTHGIERLIQQLDRRDTQRDLDLLEADIWAGVAARTRERNTSRIVLSFQAAILMIALAGSAAMGNWAAASSRTGNELALLTGRVSLAPSILLTGGGT